eukprot:Lithocolla_globosa_v1_NODE_4750_length_1375_cov_7.400000.p1 type:complete len:376 gc:universal NODE_4750_length_1375_cov_7.400000:1186-59(-)
MFKIFGFPTAKEKEKEKKEKEKDNLLFTGEVKKILMLGCGGSGKSTFFKRLASMDYHYSTDDLNESTERLRLGVLELASEELGIETLEGLETFWNQHHQLVSDSDSDDATNLLSIPLRSQHLFSLAKTFRQQPDYHPTELDVCTLPVRTTGIIERQFSKECSSTRVRVVDVGGQRSERRKWIHCYDQVNTMVYFASLTDFTQTLFEDDSTNRLKESLNLFHQLTGSQWFENSTIFLVLTHVDDLKRVIQQGKGTLLQPFLQSPIEPNVDSYVETITQLYREEIDQNSPKVSVRVCNLLSKEDSKRLWQYLFYQTTDNYWDFWPHWRPDKDFQKCFPKKTRKEIMTWLLVNNRLKLLPHELLPNVIEWICTRKGAT